MGDNKPRQLIVNVDEDHELACEDVTWGYTPTFILTVGPENFEVKTTVPMDDAEVVAILYETLIRVMEVGVFPDPPRTTEENNATSRGTLPEVHQRTESTE